MDRLIYGMKRLLNRKPSSTLNSKIDKCARIGNGSQIVNSSIKKYSYVYNSALINTKLGAFCSIAEGCVIGGGSHPLDWVSTSPVFYSGRNVLKKNFSSKKYGEFKQTTIGNDVWIGSNCLIKGGVTIGDGAVIGMGSVVTHDIPPYEIWAGNPARLIRKRFDDKTIERLLKSKWWDLSDNTIESLGDCFDDVDAFLQRLENKN